MNGDFAANCYSRAHVWRFDGGVEVPGSASPEIVPMPFARADAIDPEEAFVAAIASWNMLWFLDLARQAGFALASYRDAAEGRMARHARGRYWIDRVELNPVAKWLGDGPSFAQLHSLHEAAHRQCFIANSVRTEIVTNIQEGRP